jgi:hypothetical protein
MYIPEDLQVANLNYRIEQLENVLNQLGMVISESSIDEEDKEEFIQVIQKGIPFNQSNLGNE